MPKIDPLSWVRTGVSEGLSANESFRRYQAEAQQRTSETGDRWTASNRSVFLQLYSSVRVARAGVVDAMVAPKDQPGGGLPLTDRPTVRATGFSNYAVAFVRPIGSADVESFYYFQRSDAPLTPAEVEARAREDFEASMTDVHGTMYRYTLEGVVYTGTQTLIPTAGM